jgi:hypothetical protein
MSTATSGLVGARMVHGQLRADRGDVHGGDL